MSSTPESSADGTKIALSTDPVFRDGEPPAGRSVRHQRPRDDRAHFELGLLYDTAGRHRDAADAFAASAAVKPVLGEEREDPLVEVLALHVELLQPGGRDSDLTVGQVPMWSATSNASSGEGAARSASERSLNFRLWPTPSRLSAVAAGEPAGEAPVAPPRGDIAVSSIEPKSAVRCWRTTSLRRYGWPSAPRVLCAFARFSAVTSMRRRSAVSSAALASVSQLPSACFSSK